MSEANNPIITVTPSSKYEAIMFWWTGIEEYSFRDAWNLKSYSFHANRLTKCIRVKKFGKESFYLFIQNKFLEIIRVPTYPDQLDKDLVKQGRIRDVYTFRDTYQQWFKHSGIFKGLAFALLLTFMLPAFYCLAPKLLSLAQRSHAVELAGLCGNSCEYELKLDLFAHLGAVVVLSITVFPLIHRMFFLKLPQESAVTRWLVKCETFFIIYTIGLYAYDSKLPWYFLKRIRDGKHVLYHVVSWLF